MTIYDRPEAAPVVETITADLIQPASDALRDLVRITRYGPMDVVNRALQVYLYVEARLARGDEIIIHKRDGAHYTLQLCNPVSHQALGPEHRRQCGVVNDLDLP